MMVDAAGRVDAARYIASPNCDERPPGEAVTLLVIHNISLPPGEFGGDGVVRLFTNELDRAAHPYYRTLAGVRVSAHFLIRRSGELLRSALGMPGSPHGAGAAAATTFPSA
jgi:AmpD protein